MDAAIWWASSRIEHHHRGKQRCAHPDAYRCSTSYLQVEWEDHPAGRTRESDKALVLLQALDENRRKQAVLTYKVADLVLGPGQDGKKIVPDGLKASAMSAKQQAMLLDLIGEWAGILNEPSAAARMTQMKADLGDTWFAWSGSTTAEAGNNITAYYRIQGPNLVIEYAPQSDEPGNHVHTMYRDPGNDYGSALLKP